MASSDEESKDMTPQKIKIKERKKTLKRQNKSTEFLPEPTNTTYDIQQSFPSVIRVTEGNLTTRDIIKRQQNGGRGMIKSGGVGHNGRMNLRNRSQGELIMEL